jgi:hypothetical protein
MAVLVMPAVEQVLMQVPPEMVKPRLFLESAQLVAVAVALLITSVTPLFVMGVTVHQVVALQGRSMDLSVLLE